MYIDPWRWENPIQLFSYKDLEEAFTVWFGVLPDRTPPCPVKIHDAVDGPTL